jgi:hypothetical protein
MAELTCSIPIPTTLQELEQAIQNYKDSSLQGDELFCQWQAIREASLAQSFPQLEDDGVQGEDSY